MVDHLSQILKQIDLARSYLILIDRSSYLILIDRSSCLILIDRSSCLILLTINLVRSCKMILLNLGKKSSCKILQVLTRPLARSCLIIHLASSCKILPLAKSYQELLQDLVYGISNMQKNVGNAVIIYSLRRQLAVLIKNIGFWIYEHSVLVGLRCRYHSHSFTVFRFQNGDVSLVTIFLSLLIFWYHF